jgi:hypothetical protein
MDYYPVKYGKIMHIGTHMPYSESHIKIFERGKYDYFNNFIRIVFNSRFSWIFKN